VIEIKTKLQKNKEYDELDRFFKLPFSRNVIKTIKMPIKEKLILMQHLLIFFDFLHFKKKLHVAESKLEISCNIIDDFRQQYELALDEIYDLQGEIDECCQQKHTMPTLNTRLHKIQKKYKTQSETIDQILQRYNYHEYRKYQKRESYHKKVISEQKAEIKKLKLDTQKLETVESEKRKANKSMTYFKKQNSEYREINQNQKQVILQLQRDLSDRQKYRQSNSTI
jgi:chromosome segregation ATPase